MHMCSSNNVMVIAPWHFGVTGALLRMSCNPTCSFLHLLHLFRGSESLLTVLLKPLGRGNWGVGVGVGLGDGIPHDKISYVQDFTWEET